MHLAVLATFVWIAGGPGVQDDPVPSRQGLERALAERSARLPEALDVAELAQRLTEGEVAVAFQRYHHYEFQGETTHEERYVAFVYPRAGDPARVELGDAATIDRAVQSWRASVETGDGAATRTAGEALRGLVLDPLADPMGAVGRLYVLLDGELHGLPLDALPREEGFVGDRIEVVRLHTLRQLQTEGRPPLAEPSLLALGNPDFGTPDEGSGGPRFPALPATQSEVEGVAALFRQRFGAEPPCRVHTGAEATKQRLLEHAPGARFVHVATHGSFRPELPEPDEEGTGPLRWSRRAGSLSPLVFSQLFLAGANREPYGDGILTGAELAAANLGRTELVVLSASETAAGIRSSGWGVSSLQAAVHLAGARSSIGSLWQVPDQAAAELMTEFYRHLWTGDESKASALWKAKCDLRAQGRPPRDWAAWVLSGTPD